jgi:hypothetical protein
MSREDINEIRRRTRRFEDTGEAWTVTGSRGDGAELRWLTSPEFTAEQPSWSPDGRHIVFSTDIEGNREQ